VEVLVHFHDPNPKADISGLRADAILSCVDLYRLPAKGKRFFFCGIARLELRNSKERTPRKVRTSIVAGQEPRYADFVMTKDEQKEFTTRQDLEVQ
jgi:hypothetical protein